MMAGRNQILLSLSLHVRNLLDKEKDKYREHPRLSSFKDIEFVTNYEKTPIGKEYITLIDQDLYPTVIDKVGNGKLYQSEYLWFVVRFSERKGGNAICYKSDIIDTMLRSKEHFDLYDPLSPITPYPKIGKARIAEIRSVSSQFRDRKEFNDPLELENSVFYWVIKVHNVN